jgi:ParB family transcriptional regulator, chromosome partitioning protein
MEAKTKLIDLPLNQLVADEANVRKTLVGIDELADHVRRDGILQPILVREHPTEAGRYQIVAGHRRFAAAKQVGLETIPAVVRVIEDNEKTALQLAENIQREGLSAIEIAEGLKALVSTCGDVQSAAERLGQTTNWVHKHLALLKIEPKIMKAIHRARLGISQAREVYALARSGKTEEAIEAAAAMSEGKLTRDALAKRNQKQRIEAKSEPTPTEVVADRIFEHRGKCFSVMVTIAGQATIDETTERRIAGMMSAFDKIIEVAA